MGRKKKNRKNTVAYKKRLERIAALRRLPYSKYLQTPHWRYLRNRVLEEANWRCRWCTSEKDLQVHHLTYKRLGCELRRDLIVLCGNCHVGTHHDTDKPWLQDSLSREFRAIVGCN